jgi:selenocysteine-specific elongation factor
MELVRIVEISSTRKQGLEELRSTLAADLRAMPVRDTNEPAFLPVDRVFSKQGFGTVITGTLVRGKLAVGDQIVVAPSAGSARVRRLETFGQQMETVVAGQRVACNLVLKDGNKILVRGDAILGAERPSTRTLIVNVVDRPRSTNDKLSEHLDDQPIRFYHGTAEYHGYVRWAKDAPEDGESTGQAASSAIALVSLNESAIVQAQDRFIMRLSDESIFGGEILLRDRPRWMTRSDAELISRELLNNDLAAAVLAIVEAAPNAIARRDQPAAFLAPGPTAPALEELLSRGTLVALAEQVMKRERRQELSAQAASAVGIALEQERKTSELASNAGVELVRTLMHPRLDRQTFSQLITEEVEAKRLVRSADRLSLPASQKTSSSETSEAVIKRSELAEKILAAVNSNFCLDLKDLSTMTGTDVSKVKTAVQSLAASKDVLLVNYEFVITPAELTRAHKVLATIWNTKRTIAPTDFRESLNTTRKYAMALLQHFDDTKITRRLDSGRVLLKPPTA